MTMPVFSLATAHAHDFATDEERVELSAALMFFYAVGAIASPLVTSLLIELLRPAGDVRLHRRRPSRPDRLRHRPDAGPPHGPRPDALRLCSAHQFHLRPALPPDAERGADRSASGKPRTACAKAGPKHQQRTIPWPASSSPPRCPTSTGSSTSATSSARSLPADLYARYQRARGHEVMFICATDEHGTPAELAAAKTGEPVADYCARMHEVQAELAAGFRLSFDHFGRSSEPAEPPPHPAFRRPAGRGRADRGGLAKSRSIPRPTAASCPTATSRAPAPTAATTAPAATSARTAPSSSTRPT